MESDEKRHKAGDDDDKEDPNPGVVIDVTLRPGGLEAYLAAGKAEADAARWKTPPYLAHMLEHPPPPPMAFEGDLNKAVFLDTHIVSSNFTFGGIVRRKVEYLGRSAETGRHQYKVTRFIGHDDQGKPAYDTEIISDLPEANNMGKGL